MKIDLTKPLVNFYGQTLKEADANGEAVDVTLKSAFVNAILAPVQNETGIEKVKKYELAKLIYASDEIDLTEKDIALIKDAVGKQYPPLVVGQVYDILKV